MKMPKATSVKGYSKAKTVSLPKVPLGGVDASGKGFARSLDRFAKDVVTPQGNMLRARGNYTKNAPPAIGITGFPNITKMGKK